MGIKEAGALKTIGLLAILVLIIALIVSKNSNALVRCIAGQQIGLKTADFYQRETPHFIIKYTGADSGDIDLAAHASEYAYHAVTGFFKLEPRGKTMIIVYPDTASLARSFGWDRNQKAEGVYWAGSIRVISPEYWQEETLTDEDLPAGPLVHEFAHLMVDERTGGNYNRWWTEGIAQYTEKKITGFQFEEPFADNQEIKILPLSVLNKNFDNHQGPVAYWQSLKIVEYIAYNYGEDKLFIIMDNLKQGDNIKTAISKALGVNFNHWELSLSQALQKN